MNQRKRQLLIGCIADDFTGGSDAASFLRKVGLRTLLLDGATADAMAVEDLRPEAVVVALKSRSVPAEQAVAQSLEAAAWLLRHGARRSRHRCRVRPESRRMLFRPPASAPGC